MPNSKQPPADGDVLERHEMGEDLDEGDHPELKIDDPAQVPIAEKRATGFDS